MRLIESLTQTYSIDTDRLYATGQSMGGMTSFHLNVQYPELFAASLFVGSQWNNDLLDVLENDRFFYIVSAGDDKAFAGQSGLMAVFDRDGAAGSEHLTSFDYAYRLEAVRDWLFAQSKPNAEKMNERIDSGLTLHYNELDPQRSL